jgi:hypothetical protein
MLHSSVLEFPNSGIFPELLVDAYSSSYDLPAMIQSRSSGPVVSLLLFLLAVPAFCQRGAITAPVSLDQMTHRADRIVHGSVMSARVEPHPQLTNLSTVVITMQVQDTLKGKAATTLTFRQFIWDLRDEQDAARYLKGQELLLFLNPVSQYGLTSPVGLEQGRFRITRDRSGKAFAANGRENSGLFSGTEQRARAQHVKLSAKARSVVQHTSPGPIPVDDMKQTIRELARMQ